MKNLLRFLSLAAAVVVFFSKAGAETDDPNLKISDIDLPASLAHPYFYGTASAGNILALANNDEVHLHLIGADGVPVFLSKVTVAGLGTSSKVSSLSLCERYLALGVQDDDEGKGVAYLLKLETNGTATFLDQLSEEDAGSFGSSIVVSDDFLVVGARNTAVGINGSAGAVYLYKIDGNGKPALLSKQTAPNPYIGFGKFIDQDGESLVITDYKGAYLYHVSEDGKITFLEHLALDGTYFTNVSVSGDLLVIAGGEFKDKKASIYQINREETARLVNTMKHGVGVHELTAAIHGDLLAVSSRATGEPNAGTSLYKVETNGTATELMPLRDEGRARSFSDAITVSSKYMVVEGGSNVSDKHRFYVFHNPNWSSTANDNYDDVSDDTSDKEDDDDVVVDVVAGNSSSKVVDVSMQYNPGDAYGLFLKADGTLWHINGQGRWTGSVAQGNWTEVGSAFDTFTHIASEVDSIMQAGPYFIKKDGSLWEYKIGYSGDPTETTGPVPLFEGQTYKYAGGYGTGGWGSANAFLKSNGQLLVTRNGTSLPWGPIEVISISSGHGGAGTHVLWVEPNGSLWTMGSNYAGLLGDGTTNERWTPMAILDSGVSKVASGGYHNLFLKTDGSLWGMGEGDEGQLGIGEKLNPNDIDSSVSIKIPKKIVVSGVKAIAADNVGRTSFFIKEDGSLWGMGDNSSGQLGTGSTENAIYPVEIVPAGVTSVSSVSTSWDHTLFTKEDGSLWGIGGGHTKPVMILEFVSDTKNSAGKDTNDSEKLPVADFTIGTDDKDKDKDKGTTTGSEVTIGTAAIPFSGGTITGGGVVPVGSTVTLSAVPAGNYSFLGWSGDLSGTDNPFTFTANASMTLIANFDRSHEVKALANGGGTVTGGGSYGHNTKATLVAKPATGYRLVSWSGGYGSDASLTITVDSDKTINATFAKDERDNDLDGLTNYEELIDRNTDPNDADSDDDQLPDGKEVEWGLNPKVSNEELVTYVSNLNTGKAPDFSTPNLRSPHTAGWYYQPEWGWMWSSKEVFPYVYRSGSGSHSAGWLFFRDGSFNPIYFYDYVEGKWTTLGTE